MCQRKLLLNWEWLIVFNMQRREFIKNTCNACGLIALVGALPMALLQSCTPIPILRSASKENEIIINKTKLAAGNKLFIIRNDDLQYDVLLVKRPDNSYYALYMQCTHNDNALQANDKGLFCTAHGSTFDLEGQITNGPATRQLKKYEVKENADNLIININ